MMQSPLDTPSTDAALDRRLCVAPMLDWTTKECRYFHRLLSRRAVLYTEMVTTGALLHAEPERFLQFDPFEQPIALQLGGSDPKALAECARMAEARGYNEVNLNVGCPSDRVQNGRFGACLMAEPQLVADCLGAMMEATGIAVTVKHRIGIDDLDSYALLHRFVDTVAASGCRTFIVHARKAFLKGLSPKENRDVPPLKYDVVYQLKRDFPDLEIIINGGIKTLTEARDHLQHVDGVMIGREAYQNPYLLAAVDREIYGLDTEVVSREAVTEGLYAYIDKQLAQGAQLGWIARHILGLYQGQPGARRFRRHLSENAFKPGAGREVLEQAVSMIHPRTRTDAA